MVDRYDKADIVAVLGMAMAALDMASMAPTNIDLIGEGGLGLAGLAIVSNLYHKHKTSILSKIASKFGRSESEVEKVIDGVEDAVEDLLDDGVINDSN